MLWRKAGWRLIEWLTVNLIFSSESQDSPIKAKTKEGGTRSEH